MTATGARPESGDFASNAEALKATLAELKRMGRLEAVDAAVVYGALSMATALDRDPSNAALWRQYREAIEGLTRHDDDDGATATLLAELRGLSA